MAVIGILGFAVAQGRSVEKVKVLTVCEVLGDATRYAGTVVAVVGRLERSASLIDHYEFLSQDGCTRPVVTHGHRWLDKVQVWTASDAEVPKPPAEKPQLLQSLIATKLSNVRRTTKLGVHQEPQLKAEGGRALYAQSVAVPDAWAVVYGRIEAVPNLKEDCGAGGAAAMMCRW